MSCVSMISRTTDTRFVVIQHITTFCVWTPNQSVTDSLLSDTSIFVVDKDNIVVTTIFVSHTFFTDY